MAGHSKWANIQHRKGRQDKLRSKLFSKLAKEITDAHETIPGNTPQERKMDYHNNAVGQKYASKSLSLDALKKLVLHSSEVIRFHSELK